MGLEDKDIFRVIYDHNPDKPIEFIMAQYELARQINKKIENKEEAAELPDQNAPADAPGEQEPPRKKYTRRHLVINPGEAITDEAIYCCICGEKRNTITARHLDRHGISVEAYKKLCGYPPKQPLMSGNHHEASKRIIAIAQQERLRKKKDKNQGQ